MSMVAWIGLALLGLLLLGLARMWRAAAGRVVELEAQALESASEHESLKARLARDGATRKKQADELAAFRKKAEKTRKRKARSGQDRPMGTGARMGDLEARLERTTRERDQSQQEREVLATRVTELEAALVVARRPVEPAPVVEAVMPAISRPDLSDDLRSALSESEERLAKLEEALENAKLNETRMRKRMENQEQLYASVRSELEVKKDRLRTQEEQIQRLQAMKVVVGE